MNYTKETLNARMAEVIGYPVDKDNPFPKDMQNVIVNGESRLMYGWNPTEDANQALQVLEKYHTAKCYDIWRNRSIFDGVVSYDTFCVTLKLSHKIQSASRAIHASLTVAICLAIASAEDGQQAELEEDAQ